MNLIDTYLKVIKAFGDFKSRTARVEFWVFTLLNILVSVIIGTLSHHLSMVYSLVVLVPGLAVSIRRLHDVGKSGIYILWVLLPVVGWIYLIILFVGESEIRANKWGDVPVDVSM